MIRVMIVDDHNLLVDGLKALLDRESGITVVGQAHNGRAALEIVDVLLPDVVLMDIALPELNGIETTRQLKDDHPEIKVIILSIHASIEYIFQALRAGANGYLLKESAGTELIGAIQQVADGGRYLTSKVAESLVEDYIFQRESREIQTPLGMLSNREREVLQLVVEGNSSAKIAERLSLSRSTVDTYRSRIMTKLGIDDLAGLVRFAIEHGLLP